MLVLAVTPRVQEVVDLSRVLIGAVHGWQLFDCVRGGGATVSGCSAVLSCFLFRLSLSLLLVDTLVFLTCNDIFVLIAASKPIRVHSLRGSVDSRSD